MITPYADIASQLTGRNHDRRKVADNTYLERREGSTIAVRLHSTDIVTFDLSGVTLNTGGWYTVTTKEQMNRYGFRVYSVKGTWYVRTLEGWKGTENDPRYFDGMRFRYDGTVLNPELIPPDNSRAVAKLKRDIAAFAKLAVAELDKGMQLPGNGDCFYCLMHTDDGQSLGDAQASHDHLRLHIEEGYVVPSMIFDAVKESGYKHPGVILGVHPVEGAPGGHMLGGMTDNGYPRAMSNSVRRAVAKYLKRRLLPTEDGSKPIGTPAHRGGF